MTWGGAAWGEVPWGASPSASPTGYTLTADAGSFTLTGQDATLTYGSASGYTLTAEAGAFTLTGSDATFAYSGGEVTGGHYFDWWRKKWQEQFKAPTVAEVEEFVEESPAEALEVLREIAPQAARGVTPALLENSARLLESIAQQLHIAIKLRRIQLDEEDDEEALLMMF